MSDPRILLKTDLVSARDILCAGHCRERSAQEYATATCLVFPYRGVFVRHLDQDDAVADANQVLFFNQAEGYRISHPVAGGDASVSVTVEESLLHEMVAPEQWRGGRTLAFRRQQLRIDAPTQSLVATVRHQCRNHRSATLEAETQVLTLTRRALGERSSRQLRSTAGKRRLVNRVKVMLSSAVTRRGTLSDVAVEAGASPVYLTQAFQDVEGMPMYRYHMRLRLTRALALLRDCDDLTALSLDLGFSSHSHFTHAFRNVYGVTPADFRASVRK
jgi:AraC-like DNA-binding protein